ncbi:hypothetical protein Ccrd_024009, partial [Cynara cardunculus var. scolymus]
MKLTGLKVKSNEHLRRAIVVWGFGFQKAKKFVKFLESYNKGEVSQNQEMQKLGGPSLSEYENLQAEMSDLQTPYNDLWQLTKKHVLHIASFLYDPK